MDWNSLSQRGCLMADIGRGVASSFGSDVCILDIKYSVAPVALRLSPTEADGMLQCSGLVLIDAKKLLGDGLQCPRGHCGCLHDQGFHTNASSAKGDDQIHTWYLLPKKRSCKQCKDLGESSGYFMDNDPAVIQQLPAHMQQLLPVFKTPKSGMEEGTGRKAARFARTQAKSVTKHMPNTHTRVTTMAKVALFFELRDAHTARGKINWIGMLRDWMTAYYVQLSLPSPDDQTVIHSKDERLLKQFHAQVDNLDRQRANHYTAQKLKGVATNAVQPISAFFSKLQATCRADVAQGVAPAAAPPPAPTAEPVDTPAPKKQRLANGAAQTVPGEDTSKGQATGEGPKAGPKGEYLCTFCAYFTTKALSKSVHDCPLKQGLSKEELAAKKKQIKHGSKFNAKLWLKQRGM